MINFPTVIVDNFYKQPDKIREFALKQEYEEISPGNYPGKRTTKSIYELNINLFNGFCSKLFSIYYTPETRWIVNTNFWKVSSLDLNSLSPKNMGWIHEDDCLCAGVVYLTPDFNKELGTTMYKQISEDKTKFDSIRKKFYSTGEDIGFDNAINTHNSHYRETAKIGNEYNRLIFFDGKSFHAPSHYYMGNQTRLVQVFFVHKVESSVTTPLRRIQDYDNIPYDSL